jgi:hypothetical protein
MGYRNYIGFTTKKEYNKIKKFTNEELYKYKGEPWDSDPYERGYVSPYDIVTELYGFGKYCEFETKKMIKPFFKNKELHKDMNSDGEFVIVQKEFLAAIINQYRDKVKTYYNNMIIPFLGTEDHPTEFLNSIKTEFKYPENSYKFDFSKITDNEQTALYAIIEHVRSFRTEWVQLTPFDLESGDEITTSWKYEYGIFELVRIYKSFDWKRNIMVYYGY